MKKSIFKMVLSLFLIFLTMEVNAQENFTVVFNMPPPGTLNLSDLYNVTVTNNSGSDLSGYLVGTAKEDKDGMIAKGTTVAMMFKKGVNNIKIKDLPKTPDVEYLASDPKYKKSLIMQGTFPSGTYEICVKVISAVNNEELGSDCINQEVLETGLLSLMSPADGENIDSKVPVTFTWSSGGKMQEGGFTLRICEVMNNQTPEIAMKSNKAFFEQEGLRSSTFTYPNSGKGFEEGKTYAWKVSSVNTGSELFSFRMGGERTALIGVKVNGVYGDQTIDKCRIEFSANHPGAQSGTDTYHLKVLNATSNNLTCPVDPSACSIPPVMEFESTTGSINVVFDNFFGTADDGSGIIKTGLKNKLIAGNRYIVIFCMDNNPGFGWSDNVSSTYNWCSSFLFKGCTFTTPPIDVSKGPLGVVETQICSDFENGNLNGWNVSKADESIINTGGNPGRYIEANDNSGGPSILFNDNAYSGNWFEKIGGDSCGQFCFDVNYLFDGDDNNQTLPFLTPSVTITDGTNIATFYFDKIRVGSGWHNFCAPVGPVTPDGLLPFSNDGYWKMSAGTYLNWNSLLQNITRIRFPVDPTSYQNERIGYDNICLKSSGQCNICDNEAVACFTMKESICLKDPIMIDGSCSQNEIRYFLSVQESDANWGRFGIEETEWFPVTAPNSINVKSWYTSKGRTWKCDTYYRVKLAVQNKCTQWNSTSKLIYIKCCDESCKCGKWEKAPIINYSDGRSNVNKNITCFNKSVFGPVKTGTNFTFNSKYLCSKPNCSATYKWTIYNSNGTSHSTGSSSIMPITATAPATDGNYSFVVKAYCNGKVCDSCGFYFNTKKCFEKVQVPKQYTLCTITPSNITSTSFNITATQPSITFSNACGYFWQVCELDANNNCIPGTTVINPSQWWTYPSTTFSGYNGTSSLSGSSPGKFDINKKYRITYGVWCECMDWNQNSWIYNPTLRTGSVNFTEDNDYIMPSEMKEKIIQEFEEKNNK